MKRLALAFGLAAMTVATPVAALDLDAMSDAERRLFRAEVRAYLMENPEVLLEAIAVLEEREATERVGNDVALLAANMDDIYNDGASYVGGNPDGDITLVEFTDYRCPYCRRAHPEVAELVSSDGNIRHIIKEFPILGEASTTSSQFAIAALLLAGPKSYAKVNDALMELRNDPSEAALGKIAKDAGLDISSLLEKMKTDEVAQIIQNNRTLGQRLQISGTPTFILGDQLIRGYVPLVNMRAMVDETRTE